MKINKYFSILIVSMILGYVQLSIADKSPLIFPIPEQIIRQDGNLEINENFKIIVPENATEHDMFLARLLLVELSDTYLLPVSIQPTKDLHTLQNYILMGSRENKLIKQYLAENQLEIDFDHLNNEGYWLNVNENNILIVANTDQGALYGFQSLRQLFNKNNEKIVLPQVTVKDTPHMPFRGIRLYIPGPDNIQFFKRFVRDFMAYYKFNKVILEVNGIMRLDRHPEINVGALEFAQEMNYSRRGRPEGPGNQFQNSAHHDAGDGKILEKEQVADLVEYLHSFHIDVIPEIPSLTHSYYLLNRHRELAEIQSAEWPDTYCPSNPSSYELLFDVMDEYIKVIKPDIIHIGKDEWRMPVHVCELCKDKDYNDLLIQDILKIHGYLEKKGIKTGFWGDHLLESVRSKGFRDRNTKSGYNYQIPGALTAEQVKESIPKDILIFNWFWGDPKNDEMISQFGFNQVYGNLRPNISDWKVRRDLNRVLGGAPSSWAATTEFNFGKDLLYDFMGCADLFWAHEPLPIRDLQNVLDMQLPRIRKQFGNKAIPSQESNPIKNINISELCNLSINNELFSKNWIAKTVQYENMEFNLVDPLKNDGKIAINVTSGSNLKAVEEPVNIDIGQDVSSIIFLHASLLPAGNHKAYYKIFNFDDTADLLGWYRIEYEDGLVKTIPIRYGVNILDIKTKERAGDSWEEGKTGAPQNKYCYLADPVNCSKDMKSDPITFFAYEWTNPRYGKKITNISLQNVSRYIDTFDKQVPENKVVLAAINIVEKRNVKVVNQNK